MVVVTINLMRAFVLQSRRICALHLTRHAIIPLYFTFLLLFSFAYLT